MRIAVIADVHGNFPALDAVTGNLRRQSPDLTGSADAWTPRAGA